MFRVFRFNYFFMGLFNFFTQEIAIDLGTANTLIIHNDVVVVNEPSIVALDRNNPKNLLAVGKKALMMHEKTHESIRTVRPLKDGVIADFNAAELMIRAMHFLLPLLRAIIRRSPSLSSVRMPVLVQAQPLLSPAL